MGKTKISWFCPFLMGVAKPDEMVYNFDSLKMLLN